MGDVVRVKYTGTALPTGANTVTLFSSVTAFDMAGACQALGYKRLILDLDHSQAGTLKLYKSSNRGTSWNQVYDSGSVSAPAATTTTHYDFLIEPYQDFKLDWLNGGVDQATFEVDMALTDERGPTS